MLPPSTALEENNLGWFRCAFTSALTITKSCLLPASFACLLCLPPLPASFASLTPSNHGAFKVGMSPHYRDKLGSWLTLIILVTVCGELLVGIVQLSYIALNAISMSY
jgi:hypothetical protein